MQINRIVFLISLLIVLFIGAIQATWKQIFTFTLSKAIICRDGNFTIYCKGETFGKIMYSWEVPNGWLNFNQNPTVDMTANKHASLKLIINAN
jgi:hypothetical protein